MAKHAAGGGVKKPETYSKLRQLKFMKSKAAKPVVVQEPAKTETEKASDKASRDEWVVQRWDEVGCNVVYEDDPLPEHTGRISFTKEAQQEKADGKRAAPADDGFTEVGSRVKRQKLEEKQQPRPTQKTWVPSQPDQKVTGQEQQQGTSEKEKPARRRYYST